MKNIFSYIRENRFQPHGLCDLIKTQFENESNMPETINKLIFRKRKGSFLFYLECLAFIYEITRQYHV